MNGERVSYLDSSAIVKLAVAEPESAALRQYLRRRRPYVTSALARTEVARALMPAGPTAVRQGNEILSRFELIRLNNRILSNAGTLCPAELPSLDAIHLATAQLLGEDLAQLVTYDTRMAETARSLGWMVAAPA